MTNEQLKDIILKAIQDSPDKKIEIYQYTQTSPVASVARFAVVCDILEKEGYIKQIKGNPRKGRFSILELEPKGKVFLEDKRSFAKQNRWAFIKSAPSKIWVGLVAVVAVLSGLATIYQAKPDLWSKPKDPAPTTNRLSPADTARPLPAKPDSTPPGKLHPKSR